MYWKKFSAPLLDRVDLRFFVENHNEDGTQEERKGLNSTDEIRAGIAKAVKMQRKRQGIRNARLSPQQISEYCKIDNEVRNILDKATLKYGFSPRAIASCIKVSRTIADIAEEKSILPIHMSEAINYRKLCNNLVPEL